MLGPYHKKLRTPEEAKAIASPLSEFSFMARFFFQKKAELMELREPKKKSKRKPKPGA